MQHHESLPGNVRGSAALACSHSWWPHSPHLMNITVSNRGTQGDWVISPSLPRVIWTHQISSDTGCCWLLLSHCVRAWAAELSVRTHAIREITSIIYIDTNYKGKIRETKMCQIWGNAQRSSQQSDDNDVTKMKVTLLLQCHIATWPLQRCTLGSWQLFLFIVPAGLVLVPFCCHLTSVNQQISHWVKQQVGAFTDPSCPHPLVNGQAVSLDTFKW